MRKVEIMIHHVLRFRAAWLCHFCHWHLWCVCALGSKYRPGAAEWASWLEELLFRATCCSQVPFGGAPTGLSFSLSLHFCNHDLLKTLGMATKMS